MSHRPAFTLIELIIYMGIMVVMAAVFTRFMVDVTAVSASSRAAQAVEQNAQLILAQVTQDVRTAQSVDAAGSTFDNDHGILRLMTATGAITYRWNAEHVEYSSGGTWTNVSSGVMISVFRLHQDLSGVTVTLSAALPDGTHPLTVTTLALPRSQLY